ncbi:MAG TPA: Tad domain-containing protein [Acidimicrobiia bacterium]
MLSRDHSDRGASAVIIAMSLFLLVGFAAVAIDLAVGFNERRQDQTAADVGVMAGAVETLGTNALIRDKILDFTRRNVIATYTSSDWQARWEACTDPERANLNADGFNFLPVAAPSGWSVATIDCISVDGGGFVRVNLPQLEFSTTFGKIFGIDELETSADAIARIASRGSGILPFGLLAGTGEGTHVCLRDAAGGHAEEPCDGPDAGNFGAIESPHYGTQPNGPPQNCTGSPKSDVLAVNIALGIDHRVSTDPDGSIANENRDTCLVIAAGNTPDTLNTFTGLSNGLVEGLATGPVPGGYTPRLKQGLNPKRSIYGHSLDDRPLWEYIDPSVSSTSGNDIPAECERATFNNAVHPDFDWDGDGTLDRPESWEHLGACLTTYVNGKPGHPTPYTHQLFDESLAESPRFAYVPQFHENAWGSGNSWLHVLRFKATWLQATWWKKGGTVTVFHPGEAGTFTGGNWDLIQLSGIVIPDATLPIDLRGASPMGGVNPFEPELYR